MPPPDSPAARLAALLRDLAEMAGQSTRSLTRWTGESQSTNNRTRQGTRLPRQREVTGWLDACDADEPARHAVWVAFRAAHIGSQSWASDDPIRAQELVDRLVRGARRVEGFQTAIVPGLLQTAEYARRAIALAAGAREDQADALARRMDRQAALYRDDRTYRFVVASRVLYRGLSDDSAGVLEVQRAHLRALATRTNVEILILPADAQVPDSVPFTLYSQHPDLPDTVTIEAPHGMVTVTGADEVDVYRDLLGRLAAAAAGV